MTPKAEALLQEYVSEINEKIEDDKNKIYFEQSKNFAYIVWRWILLVPSALFVGLYGLVAVLWFFVDAEMISYIRNATDQAIAENLRALFVFAFAYGTVIPILFVVRHYRNKRDERTWREQEQVFEKKATIELVEEMLIRHGLIQLKQTSEVTNNEKTD
jgi:hypothetical protein